MSQHFEPPHERHSPSQGLTAVVGAWALAGATVGTALGATLQFTGRMDAGAATLGVSGLFLCGAAGGLAFRMERRWSAARPEVLDGRGRGRRPIHAAAYGVPIAVALPALLWLMMVGSVGAGSILPAFAFGTAAVVAAWAGLRLWSSNRLTRALEVLELGGIADARRDLEVLQGHLFASRWARTVARLNLGTLALQRGDLDAAAGWFSDIRKGQAGAHARVGLALVRALQGQDNHAQMLVGEAMSGPGARSVQGQADAVRLVLLLRAEGDAAGRELGERLLNPGSTGLFRAVLGAVRTRLGDTVGGQALRDDPRVEGVLQSGLAAVIPELR